MTPPRDSEIPNGGWQFRQPQTNWSIEHPISVTLDEAADLVTKHRLKNPAVVAQFKLSTDFYEVRQEVKDFNYKRLGIPPPPKTWPQPPSGLAAGVAAHVGNSANALKLFKQWLGDGLKPVGQEEAERRAEICANCPQNQKGDLWQRLDAYAARELRTLIEWKNGMRLSTSRDNVLQTCLPCDCWTPLKVWSQMEHVQKNTPKDVREKLHPACWILNA